MAGGRFAIVRVTGIVTGEFTAPSDATVIVPVYVPAVRPAVLNPAVSVEGASVELRVAESQLPPAGEFTVTDLVRFNVPVPELVMVIVCDGGFEPPAPPLAVILDADMESVGGGTVNSTGTVTEFTAEGEVTVMLPR
jgi:hypothetical protein